VSRCPIAMAAQIADALRDAHAHGLVHRDIKPDNVILTEGGAKLVDFGICAMIGAPDADEDGRLLGTPAYLAPERIADAPVQPAADVYGLGVLLYRALTGGLPWPADTSTGLIRAHMFAEPTPMPVIDELPPDVARICSACLDKDPHARPTSAELANTLWLATLTTHAPISPAPAFFVNVAPPSPAAALADPASASAYMLSPGPMASAMTAAMAHEPTEAGFGLPAERSAGRRRAYLFAAAIMTISLTLLGIAWGALARGDASGVAYAGASPCFADFAVDRDWGSGFSGHVTVTNASDIELRGWRVEFAFPAGQHLSAPTATTAGNNIAVALTKSADRVTVTPTAGKPYTAAITQTGKTVVAQAVSTQVLAVSQSVLVPISAAYSGTNRMPTAVVLNGTDCQTQATTKTPATTTRATQPPSTGPTQTATTTSAKGTSSESVGSSRSSGNGNVDDGNGGDGDDGNGKDHGGSDDSSGNG
jgi:eukaryotic-like serine/threonine-protein kinase